VTCIDGGTRNVAILGDPIAQAKSPQLFNALFTRHGVNAVLVPFQVPSANLALVLEGLRGVVVAVPPKLRATVHATRLSVCAAKPMVVVSGGLRNQTNASKFHFQ
jgi:shikimate dehydrogenase